jgi:hypothetical protein
MKLVLPTVMQRFRLTVVPNTNVNAKVVSTMLTPAEGIQMSIAAAPAPFVRTPISGNIQDLVSLPDVY